MLVPTSFLRGQKFPSAHPSMKVLVSFILIAYEYLYVLQSSVMVHIRRIHVQYTNSSIGEESNVCTRITSAESIIFWVGFIGLELRLGSDRG